MLAIVSHDAGGAEVLSSYVRRNALDGIYVLEGPARSVFTRKLGAISPVTLDEALERASSLLTGTSWQSDLEWRALGLARARGTRAVTFLDHWNSYPERFERAGVRHLPDEMWVGDAEAAKIAHACFGSLPIRVVPNPYLDEIRVEIEALSRGRVPSASTAILYVCEPVREHAARQHGNERYWGYVEEEALQFFLDNLAVIAPNAAHVVVRPHPSELANKYAWALQREDISVRMSAGTALAEDIAAVDIVVGCQSMAMVVALLAGKRVISSIPPGGRPCVLPHRGIELLTDLPGARRPRGNERST